MKRLCSTMAFLEQEEPRHAWTRLQFKQCVCQSQRRGGNLSPSLPKRSQTLKGLMQQSSIASRATISLRNISISDWLMKLPYCVKMAEWSSPSHYKGVRFCGSTTTCNTLALDTPVLKKQCKLRCTGKVCKLPSSQ